MFYGSPEGRFASVKDAPDTGRTETGPKFEVRPATLADLDGLVRLEREAFPFLYDAEPSTAAAIRTKYADRVRLLGDWMLVWTHPTYGICGHLVLCPSRCDANDFLTRGLDRVDIDTLREVYHPNPTSVFVVSLGTLTEVRGLAGGLGLIGLYAKSYELCQARGVQFRYFFSRLPGFARWLRERVPPDHVATLPESSRDRFAERYVRQRRLRGGVQQPIDPLLRGHVGMGAKPLWLRKDRMPGDIESMGYSVFCEAGGPACDWYLSDVRLR
jgi:hypothetical protein